MALTNTYTDNPYNESDSAFKDSLRAGIRRIEYITEPIIKMSYDSRMLIKLIQKTKNFRIYHDDFQPSSRHERANDVEFHRRIMENKANKPHIEIMQLQFLGNIKESAMNFLSSKDVPETDKPVILEKTASLAHDIFQGSQKGIPFEEILQQKVQAIQQKGDIFVHQPKPESIGQPPDLAEVPRWRGSKQDGKPLDFLKEHYGTHLSAFGAAVDAIYQDDLRKHDPKLMRGVRNQLHQEGKGRKVPEIVKTRSARTDRELANVTVEDLRKTPRLAGTLYTRQKRVAEAELTTPSPSIRQKK